MSTQPNPRPHRYFVSYTGQNYSGPVSGWSDLNLTAPIRSGADIEMIAAHLAKSNGLQHVVVVNFQRFDTSDTAEVEVGR